MSPCRNTGLDLQTLFGINAGKNDYWGNQLKNENSFDIGAFEWKNTTTDVISSELSTIKLFPNPIGSQDLIISFPSNFILDTKLDIYDIKGKLYISQILTNETNTIKINSIPLGLYFIKLSDGKNFQTFKLIKSE
jgi:hypothetical protein